MSDTTFILIVIAAVAAGAGIYWLRKFYQLRVRQHLADHPPDKLFVVPTMPDYGPAYKPNGEINWQSDEMVRGYGAKMAMMRESFGTKHQCPKCGSRKWRVANPETAGPDQDVSDLIFCHDCVFGRKDLVAGTDNDELRMSLEAFGYVVYPLADWDLYDVRMARVEAARRANAKARRVEFAEHPIDTTFTLVSDWFKRKAAGIGTERNHA